MKITIDLGSAQTQKLRDEAARLGIPMEELARATVSDFLGLPSNEFSRVAARVLDKNRELYERLS